MPSITRRVGWGVYEPCYHITGVRSSPGDANKNVNVCCSVPRKLRDRKKSVVPSLSSSATRQEQEQEYIGNALRRVLRQRETPEINHDVNVNDTTVDGGNKQRSHRWDEEARDRGAISSTPLFTHSLIFGKVPKHP